MEKTTFEMREVPGDPKRYAEMKVHGKAPILVTVEDVTRYFGPTVAYILKHEGRVAIEEDPAAPIKKKVYAY